MHAVRRNLPRRFDGYRLRAFDGNGAAASLCAIRLHGAGDRHRTGFRFNRNRAARLTAGGGRAACRERNVLRRLENNLAVGADHGAVCIDDAGLTDQAAINADFAGNDLSDVDCLIIGCGDRDMQIRRVRVNDIDALARRKYDLAALTGDCAAVLNIRRNQIDETAVTGRDIALVNHAARAGTVGELHATGEKIAVGQLECRGDEARGVDS